MLVSIRFTACALALALAAAAAPVQAASVTTNEYDSTLNSTDVDKACKDAEWTSTNKLEATCNKYTEGEPMEYVANSKDVTGSIVCGASAANNTAIKWGTTANNYWKPKFSTFKVELDSTGKTYLITGECTSNYGAYADPSSIELGDSSGLDNSNGTLNF